MSILSPTYNHERFIGACIESVLSQTYQNWEMIIVDDGSTDATWSVIQDYAARDERIRPFHQDNKGIWRLAETYNFALSQAHGELIAILEGDDLWRPQKLTLQVPYHLTCGCTLSFARNQYVDAYGDILSPELDPSPEKIPFLRSQQSDDLVIRLLQGEYYVPALTVLVSREGLDAIEGFQQPSYLPLVDYPTWLAIGAQGGTFAFQDEHLGYWRQTGGQTTWLLSREIARGEYRYARECLERDGLFFAHTNGASSDLLMSANRKRFFGDASYRSAIVAADRGEIRRGARYAAEIAQLGQYRKFGLCLAVMASKVGRNGLRWAQQQFPGSRPA